MSMSLVRQGHVKGKMNGSHNESGDHGMHEWGIRDVADNRIQNASTSVLEHLLDHDTCDVDPRNRLNGDTPLHLAIKGKWEDHEGLRVYLGMSHLHFYYNPQGLTGSRATTRSRSKYLVSPSIARRGVKLMSRIRNRYNERPIDLLPPTYPGVDAESDDEKIRAAIRRSEAEAALGDRGDVVDGKPLPSFDMEKICAD